VTARLWAPAAEVVLLFAALFCTLPYIPSHEMDRLPLFPAGAFAVILFAGSRIIRWRRRYIVILAETVLFSIFVWGSNAVANILHV
jgi:hypothetical protein